MHRIGRIPIGIDCNDVMLDRSSMKTQATMDRFGRPYILSPEERAEIRRLIRQLDEKKMPAIPGALEELEALIARGHKIYVITSNGEQEVNKIRLWINHHRLPLEVIGVGYGASKAKAAAAFGIQAFLDNDIEKLTPLIGVVPHRRLFDPERKRVVSPEIAVPVPDWCTFGEEVRHLS